MLNIALLGCGRIAQTHADLLGNGKVPHAKLVAVTDVFSEKAKQFGTQYHVPWFTNAQDMMSKVNPDLVVILTESGSHAKHTIELAQFGKHIIVEKPMALSLNDADAMIKACEDNGCRLFIVKQNRFNPAVVQLRKAADEHRFGKLVLGTIRVRWNRDQAYYDQAAWRGTKKNDGGVLGNQAIHFIDLLRSIMGGVESVFAKGITALVNIEAEDTAVAVLKFKNGALGVIEATNAARPSDLEGSVSILGEKGSVEIGGIAMNRIIHWNFVGDTADNTDFKSEFSTSPDHVYGFGHSDFYNDVVNSIRTNTPSLIDGYEGRKSLEIISAIYQSIEQGKEILL